MKLSQVIKKLQELKKDYGNVEVCAGIGREGDDPYEVLEEEGVRDVIDIDGIWSGAGSIVLILSNELQTY